MRYNRIIYYDKESGIVLHNTGEQTVVGVENYGDIRVELDYENIIVLSERNRETIGELHLELGQYEQDFSICIGYRVNPGTLELEFNYPDPSEPEPQNPVFQPPLSQQVLSLESDLGNLLLENALTRRQLRRWRILSAICCWR